MASAEAVPDPSPDAEVYAAHWGRVYETDESARTREWHCDFADCRAFIAPYCARAARGDGTVLDVGCGGTASTSWWTKAHWTRCTERRTSSR